MDPAPGEEPQLDPFSRFLPLPYRVAIITVLGVWAWGANLQYLSLLKIDVPALIRYPSRPSSSYVPHYVSTYRLATILTIPLIFSLLLFWLITRGSDSAVIAWEILPQSYLVLLVVVFILPLQRLSRSGRYRFLSILRRVSLGGLAETQDGKFGDILLADVLTSYGKIMGELFVSLCMLFSPGMSSTGKPNRACGGAYLMPFIISIPSFMRLRQCLIEFVRVRRGKQTTGGWGGQHLANALKYASAFPVIILSAMMRGYDPADVGMSEATMYRLWLLAVLANSLYSFYWDVTKDWDLNLLVPSQSRPSSRYSSYPYGLRPHRHFHSPSMYYAAIILDFLLRFTWSFKLSPHLDHFNDLEGGIFTMEALEVARRWIWIFFRVETEWVRSQVGPAPDDILLGDFQGKLDED